MSINNEKKQNVYEFIKKVNQKMLFNALFTFVWAIPLLFVMVVLVIFVFCGALRSTTPIRTFLGCYEWVISKIVKAYTVFKYSILPKSYRALKGRNFDMHSSQFIPLRIDSYKADIDYLKIINYEEKGIWHTDSFIIIKDKLYLHIIPKEDIVWTYIATSHSTTYHQYMTAPMSVNYKEEIVIRTFDRKKYSFVYYASNYHLGSVDNSVAVYRDDIYSIMDSCTNAVVGYDETYPKLFKKDPQQFRNEVFVNKVLKFISDKDSN